MLLYLLAIVWLLAGGILFLLAGLKAKKSLQPAVFRGGAKIEKVSSRKAYNKAVSRLFFLFSIPFFLAALAAAASIFIPQMLYAAVLLMVLLVFPGLLLFIRSYTSLISKYHVQPAEKTVRS